MVDADDVEKVLKGQNVFVNFLKLFRISSGTTKQRTTLGDLCQLVFEADQIIFKVIDFVLDLIRPLGSHFPQTPFELLKGSHVVFLFVLRNVFLIRQFAYQA